MRAILSAIAAALACTGVANSAEDQHVPGGIRGPSCTQWLEYRSTDDERSIAQMGAWARGALGGTNTAAVDLQGKRKVVLPTSEAIGTYVDKYCRANPSKSAISAINQLHGELIEQLEDPTKGGDTR